MRTAEELRVLESFAEPRPTTNPYLVLLLRSLREHAVVDTFTWRRALTGRYDVFHVHWPEVIVAKSSRLRRAAAAVLLRLVLVRLKLAGTAIVRTAHNLAPHEQQDRLTATVLRACDRQTAAWIRLNDHTATPAGAPATTIPHGDYGDWYAAHPLPASEPGRLVAPGLIRPYKAVPALIHAFRAVSSTPATLHVAGRPSSPEVEQEVRAAADGDPRVELSLGHLSDADLVAAVGRSQVVALPYRELHNSGAMLLALTLGRPVLVPANSVTEAAAAEFGAAWVRTYEPPLTGADLERVLDQTGGVPVDGPDLSRRGWDVLALAHLDVFRAAAGVTVGAAAG